MTEHTIDESMPDTVSTPEGDSEFAPDVPLTPDTVEQSVEGMLIPPGAAPNLYDSDQPGNTTETVDKLSVGQILA